METLYQGKFLNMVREGRWEYCERVNQTAAVMVFACTPEGKVLLVEEFRPPIGKQSLCFPAGLSGDEGPESDAVAARRELLEETGYEAAGMRYLFTGPSSPGLTSETLSFYLATDLKKVAAGGGVDNENIIIHEAPLATIDAWLAEQTAAGKSIDPRIYTGLYFLKNQSS
ncbi:MAG: NUDIX hydrolase [Akkermansia sp.]|nr:NUDIX hydrolase [Akkermansia sp.]MBR7109278.1 NUDIX hydrolase [Akkermansia sp.]